MMKLAQAAGYFDRTPVLDATTGNLLFKGQVEPYDDSRRDAGAAYRRVLSVVPGTPIPTSRAVSIFGQTWIIGSKETDGLASALREKYVLQRADLQLAVSRLPGFVSGTKAATVWGGVEWIKDVKQIEVDSRALQECNIYLPAGTDVRERDIISYSGAALLVLEAHDAPSGYVIAAALRLDQAAPAAASLVQRTYSPADGSFTSADPVSVQCLRVRWQSLFEYDSQATQRYQEGDCSLVLPADAVVTGRDRITLDGTTWAAVAVAQLAGAVVVHARRA